MCKLNAESEKVDKQTCRQDRSGQKDNETITVFFGIGYIHSWDTKKVRMREKGWRG